MGLFSSKKKIYVSSSLYNLAGDIDKRQNFLASTIASQVVAGGAGSVGEAVTSSLLNGPGMKFRSFARWARTSGYNESIQFEPLDISLGSSIDTEVIARKIPHTLEQQVAIQTAEIDLADYGFWADRWMLQNHPTEVDATYEIDFDELNLEIILTFEDGHTYRFVPEGFDPKARYLYVSYMLIEKNIFSPWSEGGEVIVDSPNDWPDTTNWDLVNTLETPRVFTCTDTVTTEVSYSDGRPGERTSNNNVHNDPFTDVARAYERAVFQGTNSTGTGTSSLVYRTTKTVFGGIKTRTTVVTNQEDIGGGVTKTTRVTTDAQYVGERYSYKEDTRVVINDQWSRMNVLIYKEGSGDAEYDAMFSPKTNIGTFMPFIPLRFYNVMVNATNYPEATEWNTKATKKGLNTKYTKLLKQLEDNASLGDIDFAYVVFGVPLNTPDKSAKKYIYRFFQMLNQHGGGGSAEYQAWRTAWAAADATQQSWLAWQQAQSNPASPLWGTPEPARAIYPATPQRKVQAFGRKWNYYMSVSWTSITEVIGTGLAKPDAKAGDIWFDSSSSQFFNETLISAGISGERTYESNTVFMYWQEDADTYRAIGVTGLWHNYMVYGGKGVDIYGNGALLDPEETGFLIPIHEEIFREISLKDATQMCTSCSYMLLNSYQVVKQKWYTKSWFKVALIVIAIVVSVVTAGVGSPVGASLAAIGSATTAAAATAAIVSLISTLAINAVISTLLIKALTPIAVSIFGEEFGALVAVVASYAVVSMAGSMAGGGTATDGLTSMSSAPELLKMTSATLNNYNQIQQSDLLQVQKQIQQLQEDYKNELSVINEASKQNLGNASGIIDLSQLTSAIGAQYENADTFLSRTLMLGSDIVNLTNNLIGSFATITTSTELIV